MQGPCSKLLHLPQTRGVLLGDPGRSKALVTGAFESVGNLVKHRASKAASVPTARHGVEDDHGSSLAQTVTQEMVGSEELEARACAAKKGIEVGYALSWRLRFLPLPEM